LTIGTIIDLAKSYDFVLFSACDTKCKLLKVQHNEEERRSGNENTLPLLQSQQQQQQAQQSSTSAVPDYIKAKGEGCSAVCLTVNIMRVGCHFKWEIYVYSRLLTDDSAFYNKLPAQLTNENEVMLFFNYLKLAVVCPGNSDMPKLMKKIKEDDVNNNQATNRLETFQLTQISDLDITIRSKECDIVLTTDTDMERCQNCQSRRHNLQKMERRQSIEAKPKKPHSSMTKFELKSKLSSVTKENKLLKRKQKKLEKKIDKLVKREGITINCNETSSIVENVVKNQDCPFEKSSAMALLWEQQKTISKFKKPSSMRWHPVIIRWCLSIYLRSPGINIKLQYLVRIYCTNVIRYTLKV